MGRTPTFSLGIEEEYLLVDRDTMELAEAPAALMAACAAELGDQVSPEFLQCQVEIGTRVCRDIGEARADLRRLRQAVADAARAHNLAPIAVSCHPFAHWKDQVHTDKARYNDLEKALAGVARRLLICGMHVHVGVDDKDLRIDLVNQLSYFLPHLLALSASSPFWQGQDTGMASYRLSVFDNLPRTGLPPQFGSWGEYRRSVDVLINLGLIEDTSKIWWDPRPSAQYPTIETRICDVAPRLERTLTLAALIQCITRMLWRLATQNQRWRIYDRFLVAENRWRAQRFGTGDGLIDFGRRELVPFADLIDEVIELVAEDAEALGCVAEVRAARGFAASGTAADRQREVYKINKEAGADHDAALRAVVADLIEAFEADL
ncbi:MAG: carboxylate-amine ligase [Pseudomonadota bacterium]